MHPSTLGAGFTAITGETGAGKTMLLGALRLLTGKRRRRVRSGPSIRRRLPKACSATTTGRSVSPVWCPGRPEAVHISTGPSPPRPSSRRESAAWWRSSANTTGFSLQRSQTVLALVDAMLDGPGLKTRDRYVDAWAKYRSAVEDQRRLGGDRTALERELDLAPLPGK